MGKLLLFILLFSRDTIITGLVPHPAAIRPATIHPAAPQPSIALKPAPRLATTKPAPITLRILNSAATPLRNIVLEWSLQTNGSITRKGTTLIPALTPNHPTIVHLPLRLPDDTAGETFLLLRYRPANPSTIRARSQPNSIHTPSTTTAPLAEQQLQLKPWCPTLTIPPAGDITLSDTNDIFTIHSPTIRISFNRQTGWLVHYQIKGIDLLDDTLGLKPNFWWPGYNDSASYYAAESARHHADSTTNYTITIDSGWRAATRDPHLQLFSNTTSADQIIIRTEYTLPATASLLHLSYTINANGEMLITQQVEPDTTQPPPRPWPLPCFGMQWILPPGFDSITAYGPLPITASGPLPTTTSGRPGSGTPTNPGAPPSSATPLTSGAPPSPGTPARIAIFHDHPTTPSTSDLLARATSTHTDIRWWTITDKDGNGLEFIADTPLLNESALHSFDSDAATPPDINSTSASNHPTSRPQIQVSIDRPAPTMPANQWPILLPMGNLRYSYKVKPLIASKISSTHL